MIECVRMFDMGIEYNCSVSSVCICGRNRSEYNDSNDQLVCFLALRLSLSSMEFHRTITSAIFATLWLE